MTCCGHTVRHTHAVRDGLSAEPVTPSEVQNAETVGRGASLPTVSGCVRLEGKAFYRDGLFGGASDSNHAGDNQSKHDHGSSEGDPAGDSRDAANGVPREA